MLLNMNFLYMVPQFLLIKVLFASLLGALIGVERDMHGRSAGLRTNLLVSLGAAVFMILSGKCNNRDRFFRCRGNNKIWFFCKRSDNSCLLVDFGKYRDELRGRILRACNHCDSYRIVQFDFLKQAGKSICQRYI
jgi:hypothetical protein